MEKLTTKKTTRHQFFGRHRNLIHIVKISEYLTLEENLKLSNLNSLIFKNAKRARHTELLGSVKKRFMATPVLNFNCIENIYQAFKKEGTHSEAQLAQVSEFLAFYSFKYIFCRLICFNNNSEDSVMQLMKHFPNCNYKYSLDLFQISENNFHAQNLNFVISSVFKKCPQLINLTITNSKLNDDNLDLLMPYIKNNSCLKTLVLNENEIGLTEKSLDFLKLLKENTSLSWVSLDLCYFSSSCIEILKEIYFSPENNIKSLTLFYNLFSLESVQNLFDFNSNNLQDGFNKSLGISFKYSPDYILKNNTREVKFTNKFMFNKYDDEEFYYIYLEMLNFEILTIEKIDFRIAYVIESIFIYNNILLGLNANLASLCQWTTNFILKLLKLDKLQFISLSEVKVNSSNNTLKLKIFDFLNVIKDLKKLRNLKLISLNSNELEGTLANILPQSSVEHLEIVNKLQRETVVVRRSRINYFNLIGSNETPNRKILIV